VERRGDRDPVQRKQCLSLGFEVNLSTNPVWTTLHMTPRTLRTHLDPPGRNRDNLHVPRIGHVIASLGWQKSKTLSNMDERGHVHFRSGMTQILLILWYASDFPRIRRATVVANYYRTS
jgi:hypothetical protein